VAAARPERAAGAGLGALSLALAGVCFLLYPAIRPFSDETSLQGAAAFATSSWLVAHSLAMVGFIALTLGLVALYLRLRQTAAGALAGLALVLSWIGVGLTLPYYGAETFGLHAVGQEALRQQSAAVLSVADAIRWQEGLWFILAGLVALAAGTILFAVAIGRSGSLPRWSGVPLAVAFALFIPQFMTPQPVRVGHGLLVLVGCFWIARGLWKPRDALPR
jgi:hypothetical protein